MQSEKDGKDPLDGLENWKDTQPIAYDLAKVYWEIYKEEN